MNWTARNVRQNMGRRQRGGQIIGAHKFVPVGRKGGALEPDLLRLICGGAAIDQPAS